MNLDNILNERLTKRTMKVKPPKKPISKEDRDHQHARECVRLLKSGDYNGGNRYHLMKYYTAVRLGYVEKSTYKILID